MVTLGSAWVVFCFLVCSQAYVNVTRCPAGLTPTGDWSKTTFLQHFFLAEIRPLRPAKQQTTVHMCYTDSHLMLRFDCIDDNPYSSYTQCNDPLFKQDVVEVFITATSPHLSKINLHHYLELEVSPNSVLFASHIYNPNLDCPGMYHSLLVRRVDAVQVYQEHPFLAVAAQFSGKPKRTSVKTLGGLSLAYPGKSSIVML